MGMILQLKERDRNRSCWLKIMVTLFLTLFVAFTDPAVGQVTLYENFEDQDLSQNPIWTGDLNDFSFIEDFGNVLLRLDTNSSPNRSQIRTASATAYGSWEFYVQVPATSNLNRVYLYLISDEDELDIVGSGSPSTANGYAIHTGSGHFDLVKITNGQQSEILLSSHTVIESGVGYQVKVTRDETGEWGIYVGEGYGSEPVFDSESIVDQTFTESKFFGIYVRYSAGNVQRYFFDNIVIRGLDEVGENGDDESDESGGGDEGESGDEPGDENGEADGDENGDGHGDGDGESDESGEGDEGESGDEPGDENGEADGDENGDGHGDGDGESDESGEGDEGESGDEPGDENGEADGDENGDGHGDGDGESDESGEGDEGESGDEPSDENGEDDGDENGDDESDESGEGDGGESGEGDGESDESDGEEGGEDEEESGDEQSDGDGEGDDGEGGDEQSDENGEVDGDKEGETNGDENGDGDEEGGTDDDGAGNDESDESGEGDEDEAESGDESGEDDGDEEGEADGDENGEGDGESDESGDEQSDENGEDDSDEEEGDEAGEGGDHGTEHADPMIRPGELIISEFYYRVPIHWRTETFDRPQYIELYNRSENQLNLRNVRISGENISINRDLIMEPDDYLVIARGVPVFEHRFGPRNFYEADQFPRFNLTTTGTITLENGQGDTLEELTFTASEWGGNGVSLERLSFDLSANLRGNWEESADALTGSPGLPNTVTIPDTPPMAESITVIAPRTIQVLFSRELDEIASSDLSNFSLDQSAAITSVEFLSGGSQLQFRTVDNFEQLKNYTFTYHRVEDIFGNRVNEVHELNFSFENPFEIQSVTILDKQSLRVQFTLPVNLSKSDEAVFRLSSGVLPNEIQFTNSKTALLTFGNPFTTGRYELIVDQLESFDPDLPEQWFIDANSSLTFFKFDEYQDGDIAINEFMYRPPDGFPRYVELYNQSGNYLNLKEWQLRRREGATNNGGMISSQNLPINPGEYLVITTDVNQMEAMFGPGPWVEMTGFPGYTQTAADQIRLISPTGKLQERIDYEPSSWGGHGVALERRSLSAPASHPGNWGESLAEQYGTPGLPNSIGPGFQAPVWAGVEVVDRETIRLKFEGPIDPDAITPNHFTIDGGLTVIHVNTVESQMIILTLDSEMISGVTYTLGAEGIRDIFGNEMSAQQRSVIYYQVEQALPGDVVINEFMYNEPDDYSRYIELFNRSDKIIDLSGWSQANNTGTRRTLIEETTLLHPNEYVVITPDENLLFFFPELQVMNVGNRLSALKNGGDSIIIESRESVVIDSLSYTPEWGGSGVSLERKSVDVPAFYRENWAESTASMLGTPGRSNTAVVDTDSLEIVQIQQFENRGFIIELSKRPEQSSALNLNNYQIRPSVTLSGVELIEKNLILTIDSEMVNNETYTIHISGISDIFGNVMESTTVELRFYRLSDVNRGDIVINEILYRRKEAGSPEFVELLNRTDKNFDISGWTLTNCTGSVTLPDGLLFPAMEYLVFTDSGFLATQSDNIIQLPGFRSLNNTSDIVKLTDRMGMTIDSLRYESSWQNNPPGVSLERRDPAALSIDPYNWVKSSDPRGSTPGEMNSRFEIDDTPPEVVFVNLFHPDSLEVVFNKFIDLNREIENLDMPKSNRRAFQSEETITPIFSVNGETVPILWYDPKEGHRIVIGTGSADSDDEMILTIDHIGDYSGNTAFELKRPIVRPLKPGDLVFNEIMYQPISDSRNGLPDQSEYIEIFNRRSYPISLEGIYLHNEPDNIGNYTVISPVNSARKWISGQGYLLFYPETTVSSFSESRVATFFDLIEDESMTPLRMDRNSLSLTNTGRQIFLADSSGKTIDWVDYSPDWHNPNRIDVRGIALERINPELETNDPMNWGSSANIEGGTPGQENSIHQSPDRIPVQRGVSLDPNPFSPDGSGFQDHLFISYKLDEPDYLIRIRIFDRYGRLVRNLVHGEPAGFEGSYIWDGRTDDGQTNRIGIYIILLEAYNSSTGRTLQFKETAVLARQF